MHNGFLIEKYDNHITSRMQCIEYNYTYLKKKKKLKEMVNNRFYVSH